MGVDMGAKDELIAVHSSPSQIAALVGADSLCYLSLKGLTEAIGVEGLCRACFDGKYPISVDDAFQKDRFEYGSFLVRSSYGDCSCEHSERNAARDEGCKLRSECGTNGNEGDGEHRSRRAL